LDAEGFLCWKIPGVKTSHHVNIIHQNEKDPGLLQATKDRNPLQVVRDSPIVPDVFL
jgi:hypothetical protein